jgi:hypothetical protein
MSHSDLSVLCDPKRSRPDGACEVCRVRRCGSHVMETNVCMHIPYIT